MDVKSKLDERTSGDTHRRNIHNDHIGPHAHDLTFYTTYRSIRGTFRVPKYSLNKSIVVLVPPRRGPLVVWWDATAKLNVCAEEKVVCHFGTRHTQVRLN